MIGAGARKFLSWMVREVPVEDLSHTKIQIEKCLGGRNECKGPEEGMHLCVQKRRVPVAGGE